MHNFGSRILERFLEHMVEEGEPIGSTTDRILEHLVANCLELSTHKFGNYVISSMFRLDINNRRRMELISKLLSETPRLCLDRWGCLVVRNIFERAARQSAVFMDRLVWSAAPSILEIASHRYGTYVAQSLIHVPAGYVDQSQERLFAWLRYHREAPSPSPENPVHALLAQDLCGSFFGRKVLATLDERARP